ncbi:PorA family protein [Nocardiopsis oceani]
MRRTVAVVLIALGVFSLALAPMMRTWMSSSLMKTPLDYYNATVNTGEVTYFNIEDVELVEDAEVEAHSTIRADVASSTDEVVVWDQFTWIKDADTDFGISSTNRRAGHDRVSGELVDCCDAMVDDSAVTQSGQGWKMPFMTEQRDYDFFETTAEEVVPMEFQGVEEVDGVEAYKFVQDVEPTVIDEREIPRDVAGLDGDGDVVGDETFSIVRTYWIEPVSGSPIDISEDHHRTVVVDGEEVLTLFSGELRFDDATRAAAIESTDQARTVLPLLHTTLPIGSLVVGIGFIGVAVVLIVTGRRAEN